MRREEFYRVVTQGPEGASVDKIISPSLALVELGYRDIAFPFKPFIVIGPIACN